MITDRFTKKIIGMVPTSIQVEEEDLLLGSDKSTYLSQRVNTLNKDVLYVVYGTFR